LADVPLDELADIAKTIPYGPSNLDIPAAGSADAFAFNGTL
jgi:hypothetical protein